jgi:hypothetical protein
VQPGTHEPAQPGTHEATQPASHESALGKFHHHAGRRPQTSAHREKAVPALLRGTQRRTG